MSVAAELLSLPLDGLAEPARPLHLRGATSHRFLSDPDTRRSERRDELKVRALRTLRAADLPPHDHPAERCRYAAFAGQEPHELRGDRVVPRWHPASVTTGEYPVRCVLEPASEPKTCSRCWIEQKADALELCRSARAWRCEVDNYVAIRPMECRTRICPDAEASRANRIANVYAAAFEATAPGRRKVLVLTTTNVPDGELAGEIDAYQHLYIRRLRRNPLIRGGRCRNTRPGGAPFHRCPSAHEPLCTALVCAEACGRRRCDHRVVEGCGLERCRHRKRCATCRDAKRCVHRLHRRERNCPAFRHPVALRGGAYSIELTYNAFDRTWHVHAHVPCDSSFLDGEERAEAWRKATRGAGWITHLKEIADRERDRRGRSLADALKYVTKLRPIIDTRRPEVLLEFMLATRGRRLVNGFGTWRGVKVPERDETEEMIEVADPHNEFLMTKLERICPGGDHLAQWTPIGTVPRIETFFVGSKQTWRPSRTRREVAATLGVDPAFPGWPEIEDAMQQRTRTGRYSRLWRRRDPLPALALEPVTPAAPEDPQGRLFR